MAALKTLTGFAILGVMLAAGARSERQFDLEGDTAVQRLIEQNVKQFAAGYDARVQLAMPELKDFSMSRVTVTRSRVGAMLDSSFGNGDVSYEVYVRFREAGASRCMTLALEWKTKTQDWRANHTSAYDRCDPVW